MKNHSTYLATTLIRFSRALIVPVILLLSAAPASGQWQAGVSFGYSHNKLDIDTGYAYDYRYDSRGGFAVGIPVKYNFNDWFGLQVEAVFIQKTYNMHRTGIYRDIYTNTRNSYLQFPVLAHFSFGGERLRGFVNAGGFLSGWLASHQKGLADPMYGEPGYGEEGEYTHPGKQYLFNEKVKFDTRRDNRFEAGLAGGIGLSYRLLSRLTLELEGRCYYSLTDMQKKYMKFQTPRYNTTFAFQVGCTYSFGKNK